MMYNTVIFKIIGKINISSVVLQLQQILTVNQLNIGALWDFCGDLIMQHALKVQKELKLTWY